MAESNRKVVLGLGNILNGDEGLGVYALQALAQTLTSPNHGLEFVDGGVLGLNLLPLIESCSHLLVLDAINAGRTPGSLLELRGEDIPFYAEARLSQHQITFQEILALAKLRDKLPPHLHLIGVQPVDLSVRIDLSSVVAAAMPQVIERAVEVLNTWGLLKA